MDHHIVAALSIAGISLDVLGSLYLAYDLLGGQHGPLRVLTRMVTYSIVFGFGYAMGLGLFFGLVVGTITGITVALELNHIAVGKGHYSLQWEGLFSALRGIAIGAGLYGTVGFRFAVTFGALLTVGQIIAYARGIRPGMNYSTSPRPGLTLTRRQLASSVERAVGYLAAAVLCGVFIRHLEHPWLFALHIGLTVGVVTTLGQWVLPVIEYYADHLPERRMGAFGIVLILCGFSLQSVQYWLALFDVPVR